jgi:hypothetical protein
MLRHALATIAYRAGTALRDAPPGFSDFSPGTGTRTAAQIVAHMGDLMDWAVSVVNGAEGYSQSTVQAWDADVRRLFEALQRFDVALANCVLDDRTAATLLQGPIADALQHTGQLAMMRRLAGSPIRAENFAAADIVPGRVGIEQSPPRYQFD